MPKQETQVWLLGWEDPLEKEMATHSSILGWEIPWTEEPGRLQSIGLHRVGCDRSDLACTHARRPVFKSQLPFRAVSTLRVCQVASVVSDSLRPHELWPTRLLCPWDFPGKNTGAGCHFLLQCMHAGLIHFVLAVFRFS